MGLQHEDIDTIKTVLNEYLLNIAYIVQETEPLT